MTDEEIHPLSCVPLDLCRMGREIYGFFAGMRKVLGGLALVWSDFSWYSARCLARTSVRPSRYCTSDSFGQDFAEYLYYLYPQLGTALYDEGFIYKPCQVLLGHEQELWQEVIAHFLPGSEGLNQLLNPNIMHCGVGIWSDATNAM
jgi:hypothetical protein